MLLGDGGEDGLMGWDEQQGESMYKGSYAKPGGGDVG